jgi:predicted enzyme related to lactoylglutathione lyase
LLGAVEIPDRGEQAIVEDSEGAIFGLLHTSTGDPEDFLSEVGDWVWMTGFSNDPVKTAGFYEEVIGYTAHDDTRTEAEGDLILGSSGSARASLYPLPEDSEYRPEWVGFVRVNDVEASVSRVEALGGRVLMDPQGPERGNLLALVADPDGAIFGLAEITPETEEVLSE